ncbi:permease prefix domain 2-containing transporter [Spirosoma telluris]|uniref:permease prefix domain 2-containing transporter n=1 Tax=Spirosoma telluris TaxID=2183553 RepID=UPI002FC2FB28
MKPNHHPPPRWATWLLATFGHPDTAEEVQGDLLELYDYWVETVGEQKANWRYGLNVLKLLRPLAKSKRSVEYPTPFLLSPAMIRNYVKIAFRNLSKSKGYSFINITGLAVGMACTVLIFLAVRHETSYDKYHTNGSRVYRVEGENIKEMHSYPGTYTGMTNALHTDLPEAELVVPLLQIGAVRSPFPTPINGSKNNTFLLATSYFIYLIING